MQYWLTLKVSTYSNHQSSFHGLEQLLPVLSVDRLALKTERKWQKQQSLLILNTNLSNNHIGGNITEGLWKARDVSLLEHPSWGGNDQEGGKHPLPLKRVFKLVLIRHWASLLKLWSIEFVALKKRFYVHVGIPTPSISVSNSISNSISIPLLPSQNALYCFMIPGLWIFYSAVSTSLSSFLHLTTFYKHTSEVLWVGF